MSDSENSQEPVFRPCGDSEWIIPAEITKAIPEFKGKIVCDAEAYAHIEEGDGDRKGHGEEIRNLGYADAVAFVADTLARASAIYEAKNNRGKTRRAYDIVAKVRHKPGDSLNRVIVYLAEFPDRSFYDVSTAHPVRVNTYKNRTPLWVHTPNAHSGLSRI